MNPRVMGGQHCATTSTFSFPAARAHDPPHPPRDLVEGGLGSPEVGAAAAWVGGGCGSTSTTTAALSTNVALSGRSDAFVEESKVAGTRERKELLRRMETKLEEMIGLRAAITAKQEKQRQEATWQQQ